MGMILMFNNDIQMFIKYKKKYIKYLENYE